MDRRRILVIFILIIIFALIAILVSGLSIGGGGYRVDVTGSATHEKPFIGDETWSVVMNDYTVTFDTSVFTVQPAWFWESSNHIVEVEISAGGSSFKQSKDIGSFQGSRTFEVTFRHIPEGIYSGTITLYQMQGGFFGFGANKVFRTSIDTGSIYVDLGYD